MGKEIVITVGFNASGKSTLAKEYVKKGYFRVNRDITGGSLEDQVVHIRNAINNGKKLIIVDNTYPTIESREGVIELGSEFGIPVRCLWLKTSFEDAQLNACLRMIDETGDILMPGEFNCPNLFPPATLFVFREKFEDKKKKQKYPGNQKPTTDHGFSSVEEIEFIRNWPDDYTNKALILDADDTIRKSTGKELWPLDPSEVEILPGRKDIIQKYFDRGHLLIGVSNQSTHEKKGYKTPLETIDACFSKTNNLLGFDIDWHYCKHYRFPVQCFCRKPHSGLGARIIRKYKLNPSECIYVGDSTSDKTFAARCGFQYSHPDEFFSGT